MKRLRRCVLLAVPVIAWTTTPAHAQWMVTPYLGANVAGGVQDGKGGPGGSVTYFGGAVGFEFDVMRYQHFFKDSEVFPLDPSAPPNCTPALGQGHVPCRDINTDAVGFMGNVVVPIRGRGAARWRPYGSAGLGLIRAWTSEEDRNQDNFGFNLGGGVLVSLNRRLGLRGDLRYFRALVEENQQAGVLFKDYDFLRVSFGATLGFPR